MGVAHKVKEPGLRRLKSLVPFSKVPFWYICLRHCHMGVDFWEGGPCLAVLALFCYFDFKKNGTGEVARARAKEPMHVTFGGMSNQVNTPMIHQGC